MNIKTNLKIAVLCGDLMSNGLAPAEDAESALISYPAPGAYTAIVRGAGDTIGVGLVEAYNILP